MVLDYFLQVRNYICFFTDVTKVFAFALRNIYVHMIYVRSKVKEEVKLTGFECSTVKKSGLHRNLALGDWSSRDRRERPLA